jgi:superfamily II DNA or RNA helicase
MFCKAGYSAVELDGGTPPKKRAEIMQKFRDGEITILCNVGIISEGVSIDDVSCCLLLRPTESHALFWQQAMRCMRYTPSKVAKIIDCVGNYSRNPLPDMEVEWSLTQSAKKRPRTDDNGNFFAGEQSLIADDIDGEGKGADIFISRGKTPAFFVPSAAVAAGFEDIVVRIDDTDDIFKIDIGFHARNGIDFIRKKKFDIFFDDLTLLSIFQGTLSGNAASGNEKHGTCGGRSQ